MRLLYGNMDVVAPISAPMLQMVPMPVALMLSTPGPKYSTIAPVPPFTVRMPATCRTRKGGGRARRRGRKGVKRGGRRGGGAPSG